MASKKALSVERMIELEKWLYNNLQEYLSSNLFDKIKLDERDYLAQAYHMPYSIISEYIDIYDDTHPRMDELKFVNDIQKKFRITNDMDVIQRIRNVRKIKKYCSKQNIVLNIPIVQMYNKLVRDNIPDIIRVNGEEPYTRVLTDEEYWEYLLKKEQEELKEVETAESLEERKNELADKLELIRAMAEFSGFSLEDILAEADRKRQHNGSFEKRLLLERVIKK